MRSIQTLVDASAALSTPFLLSLLVWATVILSIAWAVAALSRRSSPTFRYCLWQFALLGLLAVPVLFASMPGVPLGFSLGPAAKSVETAQSQPAPIEQPLTASAVDQTHPDRLIETVVAQAQGSPAADPSPRPAPGRAATAAKSASTQPTIEPAAGSAISLTWTWPTMLLAVWCLGMLVHGVWLVRAAALAKNLLRDARRVKDNRFQRVLDDLRQLYGIEPRVRLLSTDRIASPLVIGTFRPMILLPSEAAQWTSQRIAMVLSHELAHVQRQDLFWQLLARVSAGVYWFHPLVWLAVRRMRLERERACDDRVLLAGIEPTEYAAGLVECAAALGRRPLQLAFGISMAQPSQLETRVRSILDASLRRSPVSGPVRRTIACCTTALVLMLSVLRPFSPIADKTAEAAAADSLAAAVVDSAGSPSAESKPAAPTAAAPVAETKPAESPAADPEAKNKPEAQPSTTVFLNNPTAPIATPPGEMWTCTFSGNDEFLAACGGGESTNKGPGWARIWDVGTKKEVASYSAPRGIFNISLSPDGRRVAYATWDSDVVLCEVGGRELRKVTMTRHPRATFSPDGHLLVVADERKAVRVIDGVTGSDLESFAGDRMESMWLSFSADGSLLGASGGAYAEAERNNSPQLSVWDVTSRRQVFKANGLPNRVYASAISPDNKTFAAGCNKMIWLYDIATGMAREKIKTPHSFLRGLKYSPDGSILATSGGDDGAIVLWDTVNWQPKGTLQGHARRVRGLSFTRDGKTLASAGTDLAVLLWDVEKQMQIGALQQPVIRTESEAPRLLAIAYAPGGQQVAAAGEDGRLSIYDLATGNVLRYWQAHDDAVASLAYSPDGQSLASGGYDKIVRLWDPSTGESQRKLAGHKGWVVSLAFSPDGSQLASGSYDRSIIVWDPVEGSQQRALEGHTATVRSLAFSPNGLWLASGSADRTVKLWDAAGSNQATLSGHDGAIRGIAFSPDGKTLASGGEDHLLKLWNADDHSLRATLTGHSDIVSAVAFAGPTLVSASWDHSIRTWDSQTGELRARLDAGKDPVIALAVAPGGKQLLTASVGGSFKVFNASQGEDRPISSVGPFADNRSASFSPDGKFVAVGTGGGDAGDSILRVVDRGNSAEKFNVDVDPGLQHVLWSPRGDWLALGFASGDLMLVDAATGSDLVKFAEHGRGLRGLAFSVDGKLLATAAPDQIVRVYDVARRELIDSLNGHKTGVASVAFSPDGTGLVSSSDDHSAIVWNLESGERRYSLPGQAATIRSVAWSPDGQLLATGCQNGELKVWDAKNGQMIHEFSASRAALGDLCFSPDSRRLASAGADSLIRLWDIPGGQQVFTYAAHTGAVRSARFSADGKLLLSTGADGFARVWPVASE